MGFHPNDKRSLVIRSKTHTTFWKRKYSVFDMKIGFRFAM